MEKLKEYKYIILILLLVLGGCFYWFQLRPTLVKKECYKSSQTQIGKFSWNTQTNEYIYNECLLRYGLK